MGSIVTGELANKYGLKHRDVREAEKEYYRLRSEADREGMVTSTYTITPSLAAVMLEHNHDNRRLRGSVVEQYAKDMKEGRWRTNGETIIMSDNGEINTGQHRLHAVIKAGLGVVMNLCRGAKRDDRFTIDTGIVQSAGDKATQKGFKYGNEASSIAAAVLAYEQTGSINRSRITKSEVLHRIENDNEIQNTANWIGANHNKLSPLKIPKRIGGFFYYMIHKADAEKATDFMDKLKTGLGLQANSPVYLLRDRLLSPNRFNDGEKVELLTRAWNAFYNGDTMTRLSVRGNIPEMEGVKARAAA